MQAPGSRDPRALVVGLGVVAVLLIAGLTLLPGLVPVSGGGGATHPASSDPAAAVVSPSGASGASGSPAAGTGSPSSTVPATPTPSPTPKPTAKPTPTPTPAPWPASPVACTYQDLTTPHRQYADWSRTILDTAYGIPSTYAPGDLVSTSGTGMSSAFKVRSLVKADLTALAAAAAAAGSPIDIASAYRSYATQVSTFAGWVAQLGEAQARFVSARPGHSEHQLGTALDFQSKGGPLPWDVTDWATTPAGAWMAANAWTFGFVLSYPAGAQATTCYSYEPWHYRYVGIARATAIHDSGLVPRVFLWGLQ